MHFSGLRCAGRGTDSEQPGASSFTSLTLGFSVCKMGVTIGASTSQEMQCGDTWVAPTVVARGERATSETNVLLTRRDNGHTTSSKCKVCDTPI